jgi:hypothetical protein
MIRKSINRFITDFKKLPERKQYIEFFTALLSVPVLLTVIILNVNNLKNQDKKSEEKSADPVREIIITQPSEKQSAQINPTTKPCVEEIGPISIASPEEDETVNDNPVQVSINYTQRNYCAVVWSYRVNNGSWSDYDDNSVALFNLPKGSIKFDLRVKSVVTGEQKNLSRTFTYNGTSVVPTEPVASGSAN